MGIKVCCDRISKFLNTYTGWGREGIDIARKEIEIDKDDKDYGETYGEITWYHEGVPFLRDIKYCLFCGKKIETQR